MHLGLSLYNKYGLHNIGFVEWLKTYGLSADKNVIVSIAGDDCEIEKMVDTLESTNIGGVELNYSCPSVHSFSNTKIPKTSKSIYLKLNFKQNPLNYDLTNVKEIRLNSVPVKYIGGGLSGKLAQKENWSAIERWVKMDINVAGCSAISRDDIKQLEDLRCTSIGLGSIMLINPWLVKEL
jgi:hypothetical protein